MGLKCSLLGHRFGDPDVEREREERGSEVVTTTREVAVCERCDEKRVLSENKEVTAVIDESELEGSTGTTARRDAAEGGRGAPGAGAEPEREPESVREPEPDGDDLVSEAVKNVRSEREATGGVADIDVPDDEGAEIMTDEDDEPRERAYGEWPTEPGEEPEPWTDDAAPDADAPTGSDPADAGRPGDAAAGSEPNAGGADEAEPDERTPFGTGTADDVTPDTGAEIIDDDGPGGAERAGADDAGASRSASEPQDPGGSLDGGGSSAEGSASGGEGGRGSGSDIIDAEDRSDPGATPGDSPADSGTETAESEREESFEETAAAAPSRPDVYECPECGYSASATNSPLRAGDPCPECSAYLVGSERNK